ncbi:MAG: twin-arginine translocase TatA/TatE family subunit [Marinilabiliales bacterium]|nr:twin-arginine translocase TatA/TatE family subunit [Marinilabiliales bacterium]
MENLFIILGWLGAWEIIVIVLVVLIFFGGKKIPELMKGIGQGIKEFKKAVRDEPENEESKKRNKIQL